MKKSAFLIVVSFIIINLVSCTVKSARHGYLFENSQVSQLKQNKTTKMQVMQIMGSPSTISAFDKNIWYYISNETKQLSMLKPKNIHQKILQLKFKNNKIAYINTYESSDVRGFVFDGDESAIRGDDTGVLKDFVQNLGRFNKARASN